MSDRDLHRAAGRSPQVDLAHDRAERPAPGSSPIEPDAGVVVLLAGSPPGGTEESVDAIRFDFRSFMTSAGARFLALLVINLATLPLVLRYLPLTEYGVWTTFSGILAVAALANGGVATETSRRAAALIASGRPEAARMVLRQGFSAMVVTVFALGLLSALIAPAALSFAFPTLYLTRGATLTLIYAAVMATLLLSMLSSMVCLPLVIAQRQDVSNYAAVAAAAVSSVISVAGVLGGLGVWALVAAGAAQTVVSTSIQVVVQRRVAPPGLTVSWTRLRWRNVKGLYAVSTVLLLSQLCDFIDFQWDRVMLSRFVSVPASAEFSVGSTLALQVRALALLAFGGFVVAVAHVRGNRSALQDLISRQVRPSLLAGLWLMAGAVALAPAFVDLYLGADFQQAGLAMRYSALALLINTMSAPWVFYATGAGHGAKLAVPALGNLVVNMVTSWLLVVHIGFAGPLIGSVLGNAVGSVLVYVVLRRELRGLPRVMGWHELAVIAVLTAVATGVAEAVGGGLTGFILIGLLWVALSVLFLVLWRALPRLSRSA